jgi:hypothetical protein
MKKSLFAFLVTFLILGTIPMFSFAAATTDPTLISLGSQVDAFLLSEGAAVTEFTTNGTTKLETLDGLIGVGKYKAPVANPYVAVVDAGVIQNSVNGNIGVTVGVHANLFQFAGTYVTLSPSAATFWQYLNLTPRISFDSDVHGVVYGATFGLAIPLN